MTNDQYCIRETQLKTIGDITAGTYWQLASPLMVASCRIARGSTRLKDQILKLMQSLAAIHPSENKYLRIELQDTYVLTDHIAGEQG